MRGGRLLTIAALGAFAVCAAACAKVLGFEDPALAPLADGGDAQDGALLDASASADATLDAAPDATLAGDAGDAGDAEADAASRDAAIDANSADADAGPPICDSGVFGSAENCGACGHSCLGSSCEGGACVPQLFASQLLTTEAIALDQSAVYVSLFGDVRRYDKDSGARTSITGTVGAAGATRGLAVDSTTVYWSSPFVSAVLACPKTGCVDGGVASFPASGPDAVFVSGNRLLWTDDLTGAVSSANKTDPSSTAVLNDHVRAPGFASDGVGVYASNNLTQTIERLDLVDGGSTIIATPSLPPYGLVAVGGSIYFGMTGGALGKVSTSGGAITPFGAPTHSAAGIATDGTYLYWADEGSCSDAGTAIPGTGCIYRCALATCTTTAPSPVVCGLNDPADVAVDATTVYYLTFDDGSQNGTLARVANPPP